MHVADSQLGGAAGAKVPWQYQKQAGAPPPISQCAPKELTPILTGFNKRPLRVAISGAGASGICLGTQLLKGQEDGTLGPIDFTIFERESDYGGTWNVNNCERPLTDRVQASCSPAKLDTDPGCRCDVPAHVYTFSWAPYADWPE